MEAAKFDRSLGKSLAGCHDLIAAEAKYNLSCHTSFFRKVSTICGNNETKDAVMMFLCDEFGQVSS